MKEQRNYYQILHVQPDAPLEVIQSSYRTIMQRLNAHPDRGGDAASAALINRAYAVLSSKRKRAAYDRELKLKEAANQQRDEHDALSAAEHIELQPGVCPFCAAPHDHAKTITAGTFCSSCKSPLCPAENQRLERTDQRKIARIGKKTALNFYTCWPQLRPHTGVTENVSKHGMLFRAGEKIPLDSVIKIDCTQFQTIACVVNCRQAGNLLRPDWKIGVRFMTLHMRSSRGVFVSDTA